MLFNYEKLLSQRLCLLQFALSPQVNSQLGHLVVINNQTCYFGFGRQLLKKNQHSLKISNLLILPSFFAQLLVVKKLSS